MRRLRARSPGAKLLVVLVTVGGALGAIGLLALAYVALFASDLHAAPGRLGAEMGLQRVVARKGDERADWYGGRVQERAFALTFVTQQVRRYRTTSGTRSSTEAALRIAMPVQRVGGGALDIRRGFQDLTATTSFEEAFPQRDGAEVLGGTARQGLLAFVRDHGAVRLRDLASQPPQLLPAELGFTGSWVLSHDVPSPDLAPSATKVWERVRALHALALVLEGDDR